MHTIDGIERQHQGKSGRLAVPAPRSGRGRAGLTVGVAEEFLLVDYRTRRVSPRAPLVLAAAAGRLPGLQPEITQFQVETATPICHTMAEVRANLVDSREKLAGTARRQGLRLAATGTPVLGRATPPPLTDNARYQQMAAEFGAVTDGLSICGCHVHVGIPGPEEGIRASNYLRPWLPVLLALSANSPFWEGRDTGYASWRYLVWARWPTAGPPPVFESADQYEHAVRSLMQVGAAMDRAMAYWDIRLSQQHPTNELPSPRRLTWRCFPPPCPDRWSRPPPRTPAHRGACRSTCCGPPAGGPPATGSTAAASTRSPGTRCPRRCWSGSAVRSRC